MLIDAEIMAEKKKCKMAADRHLALFKTLIAEQRVPLGYRFSITVPNLAQ